MKRCARFKPGVGDRDRSIVRVNNIFHDRQAKAATGYTRLMPVATNPVEPLKNRLAMPFGNAGAGVLYRENYVIFISCDGHTDLSVIRRVFIGITQQVK